jgi:hypothetical protein
LVVKVTANLNSICDPSPLPFVGTTQGLSQISAASFVCDANQSKTDLGIVNESQLLRFGISWLLPKFTQVLWTWLRAIVPTVCDCFQASYGPRDLRFSDLALDFQYACTATQHPKWLSRKNYSAAVRPFSLQIDKCSNISKHF